MKVFTDTKRNLKRGWYNGVSDKNENNEEFLTRSGCSNILKKMKIAEIK